MKRTINPNLLHEYNVLSEQGRVLPIKVPKTYKELIQEEIETVGTGGPLYRSVYPEIGRIALVAPYEVADYVSDKENMPEGAENIFIRKYQDRVLFLVTDECFGNCQYCFRNNLLNEQKEQTLPCLEDKKQELVRILRSNPEIREVILSGGDPLAIEEKELINIFELIKGVDTALNIRVHTRSVVYAPEVFTKELIEMLAKFGVRVYFHINHPYEVGDCQKDIFAKMHKAGIGCYNQCPIVRGINDDVEVIKDLVETLDNQKVRQVNFFIPDPIFFSADFRLPLADLYSIFDELNWKAPSWANTARLVLDTPIGKVRREDIKSWNKESGEVIFQREGKEVKYFDLPRKMYVAGDKKRMLWKRANSGE